MWKGTAVEYFIVLSHGGMGENVARMGEMRSAYIQCLGWKT